MKKLAFIVIVILIAAAAVLWINYQKNSQQAAKPANSLGAQIYTQTQNPVQDKIPDTNPFNQKTNPFDQ